jgi:O-antigen/teichoic acid export membrane protein
LGGKYVESISVLRLLSFSIFFNSVGTMLGSLSMIALGYASAYSRFIAILLAASIMLNLILIPRFMHNGAALTALITSIFMAVMSVLILKRRELS